jgi:predicted aconitase with swiveling domain
MTYRFTVFLLMGMTILSSCTKKDSNVGGKAAVEAPALTQSAGGPHVFVSLKNGSTVPGTIVASSPTDMIVAGDDGIERKIPLAQIKSVEYGEVQKVELARQASSEIPPPARPAPPRPEAQRTRPPSAPARPQYPEVTTRTYELSLGSEISVRTNEAIDSGIAAEGQSFDAEVTREARDANGDVVIPRGSRATVVIKSASKGGRFRGASDLVLDLQAVFIDGKPYSIDSADISQKGKSGVGVNQRTAKYTGGGAALGAIIGAIAGGGKGAAIGAGAGAGAGALTQVLTKGSAIRVPAESVLTFSLDKPLKVTAAQ